MRILVTPQRANPTEWSNTLNQFLGNLPMIFLSVFDNFVGLAVKGLTIDLCYKLSRTEL